MTQKADPDRSLPKLSIVIPLYNERDNVVPLVEEIHAALASLVGSHYEIVIVDDGSSDDTAARVPVQPGGPEAPAVRLLRFEANAGQTAAMLVGIGAAEGEIIILMDGDRQNDPADICRLLQGIEAGADLVCGYRENRQDSAVKRFSSKVANRVRNWVIADGVRDTGCTLKAMRRECRSALIPFRGMHRFIPSLIKTAGYHIAEVPVHHRPRVSGVSKYGLGNRAFRATLDLLGVWWLEKRWLQYRLTK